MDFVFGLDVLPSSAIKYWAEKFTTIGGGNAATAAVTISRLGGRALLLGRIGDDNIGRQVINDLTASGVDTAMLQTCAGATTSISAVLLDRAGERQVINYVDKSMSSDVTGIAPLPGDVGVVLGDCKWLEASSEMFRQARRRNIPTVLDADMRVLPPELLQLTTVAAFSRETLANSAGTPSIEDGLRYHASRYDGAMVVTDGSEGLYWLDGAELRHLPAYQVKAVDTLGAGDVFHGALALGIARNMSLEKALQYASATAAIKVTRFGGRAGCPSETEVQYLINTNRTPSSIAMSDAV